MSMERERVLLIHPAADNRNLVSVEAPLGLLYIAAFLRHKGVCVKVVDLNVHKGMPPFFITELQNYAPTIVGLTSHFGNRYQTREVASLVKSVNQNIHVVVGGPQPSINPAEYCTRNIDYIIPYEGEETMYRFVCAQDKKVIDGVIVVSGNENTGEFLVTRKVVEDLDSLPFPAHDLIDMSAYYVNAYKRRPIASMITSRGCPQRCIFCCQAVSGKKWRGRSPESVVDEMYWLTQVLRAKEIVIQDDNFCFDLDRVRSICELILSRKLEFYWQLSGGVRADRISKDLLVLMKRAGCWKIVLSPEVGTNDDLRQLKKDMTIEQFAELAAWCKEVGVIFDANFIMGFPFQKKKNWQKTIDFAMSLDPALMNVLKLMPFPGTEIYNQVFNKKMYTNESTYHYRSEDKTLEWMYWKAYITFYIRPAKLIEIFNVLGARQFMLLVKYAIQLFFQKPLKLKKTLTMK